MKKIMLLIFLALFTVSCLEKTENSDMPIETVDTPHTLLEGGDVTIYKISSNGDRENIYAAPAEEFETDGPSIAFDEIFLIELKNATYTTLDTNERISPPESMVWKIMSASIDENVLNFISPLTTWAADSALKLINIGYSPREAYEETAKSLSNMLGNNFNTPILNPYKSTFSNKPSYIHGLILLGMERAALITTRTCSDKDRWRVYFKNILNWENFLLGNSSPENVNFSCVEEKVDPYTHGTLTIKGIAESLLKNNLMQETASGEELSLLAKRIYNNIDFKIKPDNFSENYTPVDIIATGINKDFIINRTVNINVKSVSHTNNKEVIYIGASLDNEIITSKNSSEFDYLLNPYSILAGKHQFTVAALDSEGNLTYKKIPLKTTGRHRIIRIKTPENEEGQIIPLSDGYKIKGNFIIEASYKPANNKEYIYFSASDSKIDKYFRGKFFSSSLEDKTLHLEAYIPAQKDSSLLEESGYLFTTITLWKGENNSKQKLDEVNLKIINHTPLLSMKFLSDECYLENNINICKRTSPLSFYLKLESEMSLNNYETYISMFDHRGNKMDYDCSYEQSRYYCILYNDMRTADGPVKIEYHFKETGISNSKVSISNIYINNHFLKKIVDITETKRMPDKAAKYAGTVADLDKDGIEDIVTYGIRSEGTYDNPKESKWGINIHWNDSVIPFEKTTTIGLPPDTVTIKQIVSCDFNRDGFLDLIASDPEYPEGTAEGRVLIWYGPFSKDNPSLEMEPTQLQAPEEYRVENAKYGSFINCQPLKGRPTELIVGFREREENGRYISEIPEFYTMKYIYHSNNEIQYCFFNLVGPNIFRSYRIKKIGRINRKYGIYYIGIDSTANAQIAYNSTSFATNDKWCSYQQGPTITSTWYARDVYPLGDLNHDNIVDFAIVYVEPVNNKSIIPRGKVAVFISDDSWLDDNTPEPSFILTAEDLAPYASYYFGTGGVISGDFDSDGMLDIAVGSPYYKDNRGMISVFYGNFIHPFHYSIRESWIESIINSNGERGDNLGSALFTLKHLGAEPINSIFTSRTATKISDETSVQEGMPLLITQK